MTIKVKNILRTLFQHVFIFLSLLAACRLRLRKRRRIRDESATSRVSFDSSDISSHLLRAVDSEQDFLLVSLLHLLSSIMSLYISPTTVWLSSYFIHCLVPDAPLHTAAIVEKKLQPEQETSTVRYLFLSRKILSQNESRLCIEECYAFTRVMKEVFVE